MSVAHTIGHSLHATLYELGLNSAEPEQLAAFYSKTLGYRFETSVEGLLGTALERRLTLKRGAAKTLAYAAYAVPDLDELDALKRRLDRAGVASSRVDKAGFEPKALTFSDPDGNSFLFGVASARAAAGDTISKRPARIQHVVFASTNVERLLSFLVDVVGFTLSDRVVDEQGGLRTAFVRCSRDHHSVAIFAAKENRLDHHCYEAGDWNLIRDWADHFAKLRVPLKWGPGRHGPGDNLFLFIHDPEGNWVEISAELEQVAENRPVGVWPHEEYTLNTWGTGLLRS
jgi:catechol 2,3-dioxygenase-like lactoylglutathione lyase family enzyme